MINYSVLTVGQLKDQNLKAIEDEFLKRLSSNSLFQLKIYEVKSQSEDLEKESKDIHQKLFDLKLLGHSEIFLMKENGLEFSSSSFSEFLFQDSMRQKHVVFIFGGAKGHGPHVLKLKHRSLSLSQMTFPHMVARVLLVEQLYRAVCIQTKHPYHK